MANRFEIAGFDPRVLTARVEASHPLDSLIAMSVSGRMDAPLSIFSFTDGGVLAPGITQGVVIPGLGPLAGISRGARAFLDHGGCLAIAQYKAGFD